MLSGYDISHHNYKYLMSKATGQDLRKVARDGFLIMKATEGLTFDDPRCMEYVRTVGVSNIINGAAQIGFYHYARPEYNEAVREAEHFLSVVRPYLGSAVLALDFEGRALYMPGAVEWSYTWLEAVRIRTGVRPLLYIQKSEFKRFGKVAEADYGLWLASWSKGKPKDVRPWPFMAVWQYDTVGLDKDIFFGDAAAWRKYAAG